MAENDFEELNIPPRKSGRKAPRRPSDPQGNGAIREVPQDSTGKTRESKAQDRENGEAREDRSARKGGKQPRVKFPWREVLLTFLITALLFGAVGAVISYKLEESRYAYKRQPVVIQESEALNAIKDSLIAGDSHLAALRRGFKSYIVAYDPAGAYVFKPIDFSLKMHNRSSEKVQKLGSGEWQYVENGRTVSGKCVDVSSHQGEIDWQKVAADGVEYAMIRAGLRGYGEAGNLKADEQFETNLTEAQKNGIRTGVYFFTQALTEEEVDQEVAFLLDILGDHPVQGPVAVDVELTAEGTGRADTLPADQRTALVKRFCDKVKDAGYVPMIYQNFESAVLMTNVEQLEDISKWYASYSSELYYPYYYSVWQYTSTGRVDGIKENVDLDMVFDKELFGH